MITKNSSGFAILIVLALAAIIILTGFIAWCVFDASRQSNTKTQQQTTTQTKTTPADPNAGYVVIKEWGVRFKPVGGVGGVIYRIHPLDGGEYASFSTSALAQYGDLCGVGTNSLNPLGTIGRDKTPKPESTFTKRIGDYYYTYTTPQSPCSNVQTAETLAETTLNSLFRPSIATLEAAK